MSRATSALALCALASVPAALAATPSARRPSAQVTAVAVSVVIPGRSPATSPAAPAGGGVSRLPSYVYPDDGSVVVAGATTASDRVARAATASVDGATQLDELSLFDGEITAASLSSSASASAGAHGAHGGAATATVVGLQALGRPLARGSLELGDWGTLSVAARTHSAVTEAGVRAYQGSIAAVELTLLRAHDGLPAGSEIELGLVEVDAAPPPPPRPPPRPAPPQIVPGDRPQLLPPTTGPLVGVPQVIEPALGAGRHVFPVFGAVSLSDDYGWSVAGAPYARSVDLLGQLGQPVVAVAAGTLYGVGWNRVSGNRLALRDRFGNEFTYTHLSAFSSLAADGAHVEPGQVIGFLGDTGASDGLPAHLGFEVQPVSLLYLGSDGAVDPAAYLDAWPTVSSVALAPGPGWAPSVPGTVPAPEPGAYLVTSRVLVALPPSRRGR